ncbi:MAG: DciA family protein [Sneathiella sp.]
MRQTQNRAGPRAIASLVGKSSRAALIRRGFAQADILTHWPAIVGPNLANFSSPEKLSYSRQSNKEATLRIRVAPGWAPEFQHFEPLIVERINSFFGYRAVARLQLIQAPVQKPETRTKTPPAPLSVTQENWIKETIKNITDESLKKRLEAVATSMLGARNRGQEHDKNATDAD